MSETMKQTDLIFLLTRYLHLGFKGHFLDAFPRKNLGVGMCLVDMVGLALPLLRTIFSIQYFTWMFIII